MNELRTTKGDVLFLILGELLVSLLTLGGFFLFEHLDHTAIIGVLVGSFVSVMNFALLAFAVNRALARAMSERKKGEMTDEEIEAFVAAHGAEVQKQVKATYFFRQTALLLFLLVFLILKLANVIAVAIPLLMFRPILMVRELILKKQNKKG